MHCWPVINDAVLQMHAVTDQHAKPSVRERKAPDGFVLGFAGSEVQGQKRCSQKVRHPMVQHTAQLLVLSRWLLVHGLHLISCILLHRSEAVCAASRLVKFFHMLMTCACRIRNARTSCCLLPELLVLGQ